MGKPDFLPLHEGGRLCPPFLRARDTKAPAPRSHFRRRKPFFQFFAFLLLLPYVLSASPLYYGYSNYQIITDFGFRPRPYFEAMKSHGVNLQRIWILGYSGSAAAIKETMPFALVAPASRRHPKFDLQRMNPSYLNRLQRVLELASEHDQRVMLTLFDHWSLATSAVFPQTPWYYKNNNQRLLRNPFPDFYNLRNTKLVDVQRNLVQEVARVAAPYQPIYEIMNEAAGGSCDQLASWHKQIANWVLEIDRKAEFAVNFVNSCPQVINADWVNVVSFHANEWMAKGICELSGQYPKKTVIIDTDGAWKVRHDNRLVKKWMTTAFQCGASFNHKDDIYSPDFEVLNLLRKARDSYDERSIIRSDSPAWEK